MTTSHDRVFFDMFMLVIGGIVLFAAFIFVLARYLAAQTQEQWVEEDIIAQTRLEDRIAPAGHVAIQGEDNAALAMPEPEPTEPVAAAAAEVPSGDQVYQSACVVCHDAGVAGAPKLGDQAGWADRIAQGSDVLYEHAIKGYQGKAGYMPPKGGQMQLADEAVMAAVDYMVEQAQ